MPRIFGMSLWRALLLGMLLAVIGGAAAAAGVLSVMAFMVFFGDDSRLTPEAIMARIREETTIYTVDEKTQIGSFFSSEHRRYISIDEVPAHMINAIIASEDKNFYNHFGIDPISIVGAVGEGLRGEKFRGASTITQQTVKNILSDWEYSLRRKFREAVAAMQIERRFSKRQILEFYLNQFYVSGNGNGIGIAARYYFNKDVRDLDLVEAAFIAGSVKGPSAYDPFIKFTKDKRERAIEAAFQRKNYVLKRMYEQGWIGEEEFRAAYEKPVQFNRGRFRTSEVALVQLIRGQMQRKEILQALNLETIRDLDHAGFKIFTTLDRDLQDSAQLAVRRNLSRLETILSGFKPEDPEQFVVQRDLIPEAYYYGKVIEIGTDEAGKPIIRLDFGLPKGTIPYDSLMRYAKWLDLTQFQGFEVQLKKMLAQIKVGDILFSEVKTYDKDTHEAVVEMHKFPRVNGGLIVVDRGEVRAVVSGFDTKGFNRAIAARRPPGSVFKSLVYYAGLTLGWNLTDQLDNERQIFPYQGQFYYPSPDHESPYSQTSILWSGAMSENLASVSLTARLVEKLNLEQFKELMGFLGLMPLDGESPQDFHFRVAKAVGVQLEPEGVREFQLTNAIRDLEPDLIFEGQQSVHAQLKKMWWGKGYTAEIGNIYQAPDDDVPADRKAARIKLAKNNFLRMGKLMGNLSEDWSAIERKIQEVGIDQATNDPDVRSRLRFFRVLPASGNKPELGYVRTYDDENPPANVRNLAAIQAELPTPGRELNALDVQAIWDTNVLLGNAEVTVTDVKLDGYLPAGLYTQLTQYVEQRYQNIMATDEKYEFTKYYQHHDFRIALGLEYLVLLTRALGVQSPLEPVLSYPLGSNDVTAAEVAKIYQSFISGKIYRFYEEGSSNQLNFIRRVEDRFGNVLYEPKRKEIQLTAPEYSAQMREILRRTVTHGTGRSARGELHVVIGGDENGKGGKPISIPAFGKTGTTNDYTNAYFAGFLPYPTEKNMPLDVENSYVITSYVGYDHNLSMKRGGLRISGAQGALPAWIGLAKAIFEKKKYADFLDVLDLNVVSRGEWPISYLEGTVPVKIDLPRGVVLRRGEDIEEERYALTNVEETGETFQNEFVVGNLVKSTVRVPIGDGGEPARKFGLFNRDDEGVATLEPEISSSEKEKPKVESKEVDTRPVSQDPIQTPPPGTEQNEEVEAAPPEEARTKTEKPIQGASETATRPPEEELFEPAAEPEGTEEGGFVEEELW